MIIRSGNTAGAVKIQDHGGTTAVGGELSVNGDLKISGHIFMSGSSEMSLESRLMEMEEKMEALMETNARLSQMLMEKSA